MNFSIRAFENCKTAHRRGAYFLVFLSLLLVSGCGGGSSLKPQVDAITFTDATGTPQKSQRSMLSAGEGTYMDVTIADDTALLGANWTVTCKSALPPGTPLPPGETEDTSCGTFAPMHTVSGPVPSYATSDAGYVTFYTAPAAVPKGGTVTLYASSTSNPSQHSSVTLTIDALVISISFATAPPYAIKTGANATLTAVVTNDDANAGVSWTVTCASTVAGACGSFNQVQTTSTSGVATTTYTAPATVPSDGNVQVTATSNADPNKSATATIQIN